MHKRIAFAVAALALLGSAAHAQTNDTDDTSLDELLREVERALPPILDGDNSDLAENLLGVPLPEPKFDLNKARLPLFGRRIVRLAPDCQRTGTPVGGPDQGDCRASSGEEQGTGEFIALDFSKTPGVGNIKYVVRPPNPDKLPVIKMTDADAYQKAKTFLAETLGLPPEELVDPPTGALPVSTLVIGFDKGSGMEPLPIMKTVRFGRAMKLPTPIPVPPPGGQPGAVPQRLDYVAGPGTATVHMTDSGPMGATVQGWQTLRKPQKLDPRNAKTRNELATEIAGDLFRTGGGRTAIIAVLIGLSSDFQGSFGELLPAVKVFVSPVARDLEEDDQNIQGTTAGFVAEYALIDPVGERAE
jgi:hypothetical protein